MRRLAILIFLISIYTTNICAQQVHISAPLVEMPGCTSISDLYAVSINNFEQETVQAAMEIEIIYEGNSLGNGLVARGQLSGAPIFNLPVGITQINTVNIASFFPNRNIEFLDNALDNLNSTSSCLPPGEYEVCISLFGVNQNGQVDVQNQISRTCFKRIKTSTNNIFLISPYDNSDVLLNLPIFTWTPVATFNSRSNYIIEIVEILDHQTPFEAFRSNPIYFSQARLKKNTFQYPISARSFEPCRNYVWRVGFYEDTGFDNSQFIEAIKPTVVSEIWRFSSNCNMGGFENPKSISPLSLVQPMEGATLPDNHNVFFIWNPVVGQSVQNYQLRVVEKSKSQNADAAFLNNPVIYSKTIADLNYHYWLNSQDFLDLEKEYVWGILPFDEEGIPLFPSNSLESNTFKFGALSINIAMLCPYQMQPFSLISKEYSPESNSWLIEISKPIDNAESLIESAETYEFEGEEISVPPIFSEYIFSTDNDEIILSNTIVNDNSIQIVATSNDENFTDFNLCAKRTFTSAVLDCVDEKCLPIQFIDEEEELTCDDITLELKLSADPVFTEETSMITDDPLISVKNYFNCKFDVLTKVQNHPGTGLSLSNDQVTLELIDSNIPVSFGTLDYYSDSYAIAPEWSEEFPVERKDELYFKVKACVTPSVVKYFGTDEEKTICTKNSCIEFEYGTPSFNEEIPDLTSFEVMQGFPKLNPDKTVLVQFDIEDNADEFIDWEIRTKSLEILPRDNTAKLEVIEANDETFTYTVLLRDIVTLDTIDLEEEDIELFLKPEYTYERLKREDTDSLTLFDTKDVSTLIPLSWFLKEPCILEIKNFRESAPLSFNDQSSDNFKSEKILDFFKPKFSYSTTIPDNDTPSSPYWRRNQRIKFKNIESSPVSIRIDSLKYAENVETKYMIIPNWDEDPTLDSNNKDLISFKMEACLSVDVLDKETSDFICTRTECIPIEHNGELVEDFVCPVDFQFNISSEPIFYTDVSPYLHFSHDFNLETTIKPGFENDIQIKYDYDYEIVYSNIGLTCYESYDTENKFIIHPDWYNDPDFTEQNVAYKINLCYSALVLDSEGLLCIEEKCETLEKKSDPCLLSVKIKIDKDNNDIYTLESKLKNQDTNAEFTYLWEFSDGETASTESTIKIFEDPSTETVKLTVSGLDKNGKQCTAIAEKDIKIRPGCDYQACDIGCGTSPSTNLKVGDEINLCGDLTIKITELPRKSSTNLKGKGTVRIPWLLSDILVEFDGIKVNESSEFCEGVIYADSYDTAPEYPIQAATNAAYELSENLIININNHINGANGVLSHIPEDAVLDAAQDQINPLKVPLGFTNVPIGSKNTTDKTKYTLGIASLKFTPGQNYIKAIAAVDFPADDFPGDGDAVLYFQSDHFFFNSTGPILSTGNSPDFKFEITKPTTLQYGTNDGDPLHLIFNDAQSNNGWGTSLSLTSECNKPYKFCLSADIDIEMPRSWLEPIKDPNPLTKVKANTKLELCNFKDFITQISLPNCLIANTEGLELEVQELTWDHSTIRNADNFAFPENYNETGIPESINEFKGFFLKSAIVKLPEDLSTYDDNRRIEVDLENWIMHKGYGMSGKIYAENIVNFPNMNVSDLGASIDTFKLEMVNNSITHGYLKGEITLPICDYDDPNNPTPVNRLDFKGMYGSYPPNTVTNGLLFLITPQQNYECPFFANGELEIYNTSNLYIMFAEDHSAVDFTLNGKLNFPNKEIGPASLQMDADFEDLSLNYTNYKSESSDDIFLFNHGVWSFASPQKKMSEFNFTIENFESVTEVDLKGGELYVGGIGFDAVLNLNKKVGGVAGLQILGTIKKNPNERLKSEFKGIKLDSITINANLSGAKLNGYVKFKEDNVWGKAVEGAVNAKFKSLGVGVNASLLFGNNFNLYGNNGYRYFKVEASAMWPNPGVPLFPGVAMRGVGAGFYNNMIATFPPTTGLNNSTTQSSSPVFNGSVFSPEKDSMGLKLQIEFATSPKEDAFNGNLGFNAVINKSTGGLTKFGIEGNVYSGAGILEREKAFATGSVEAYYDFTTDIFDLNADLNINKEELVVDAGLKFNVNNSTNKYYFHFGTWDQPNYARFKGFNSGIYLMFGNTNITSPNDWFMDNTKSKLNEVQPGLGNAFIVPNFEGSSAIGLGKGFAAGLGIEFGEEKEIDLFKKGGKLKLGFNLAAGAEFNISLLDYGPGELCSCCAFNPIGMNGKYFKANLAAYLIAEGYVIKYKSNGDVNWRKPIVEFKAGAYVLASFPRPWGVKGAMGGSISLMGGVIEADVSFDFEVGDYCSPIYQAVQQTFEQENVADSIFIFDQVFVDEGNEDFDPNTPLRWTSFYDDGEQFSLPEQQSNGSVIVKNFKIEITPELLEKKINNPTQWQYIDDVDYDPVWGKDQIGRYMHLFNAESINERRIEVLRRSSDGTEFYNPKKWSSEKLIGDKIYVGDFNGDGKDDLLTNSTINAGTKVLISKGNGFEVGVVWSNDPNFGEEWLIGDFNGDGKDDIAVYFQSVGVRVSLSNGSSFDPPVTWFDGVGIAYGLCVGDANDDGMDDLLYTLGDSFDNPQVCISSGNSFATALQYSYHDFESEEFKKLLSLRSPYHGYFSNDNFLDNLSTTSSNEERFIKLFKRYNETTYDSDEVLGSFPIQEMKNVICGDFDGNGKDDLLMYYPADRTFETDKIIHNRLKPNTEYDFWLKGEVIDTGGNWVVAEEHIHRKFKTNDEGLIMPQINPDPIPTFTPSESSLGSNPRVNIVIFNPPNGTFNTLPQQDFQNEVINNNGN